MNNSRPTRKTVLDDLGSSARNMYCQFTDLRNEASVESFFLLRLIQDLGYNDTQIKPKESLDVLTIGRGRKKEKYKPDYALMFRSEPRCIIDAKGVNEDLDKWIEQCSGYCLALNRKYENRNPVRYFVLSNGKTTKLYEWDKDAEILSLDFSDFAWGNSKFEHLKSVIGSKNISTSIPEPMRTENATFKFTRPNTSKARQIFATCHKVIWKSEGYGPGPAFLAFAKLMFVKLWADQSIRHNSATRVLFSDDKIEVNLPKSSVTFSVNWIEQRESEGVINPINTMFINLRNEIEKDIQLRKKKRIFNKDEELDLRPDTVKDVVRRLQNFDMFGIDEDLNGRLFETFLNATMRGKELGQFFTPRSIVKLMTQLADLQVDRKKQNRIIDGCCGSGGFLIEALTVMRNKVRSNDSLSSSEKNDLIEQIANNCIFGIDYGKDPPLARIARINMYLHGDGGSKIYYADALDKTIDSEAMNDPEVVQNMQELRESLDNTKFDVVLTNPPFSMTKEAKNPSELRILEQYVLAHNDNNSSKIKPSLKSSIMFTERYGDLLEIGGKLITIIDDSVLAGKNFPKVRRFILDNFIIKAIISLHGDAFRRSGARVKTSILYLIKKGTQDTQGNCFVYESKFIGRDDVPPKTRPSVFDTSKQHAQNEVEEILSAFNEFEKGVKGTWSVESSKLIDRLDAKHLTPWSVMELKSDWEKAGAYPEIINNIVDIIEDEVIIDPEKKYEFLKVTYDGSAEKGDSVLGKEISYKKVFMATKNDIIISNINAVNRATGVMSEDLCKCLVSPAFTIIRIKQHLREEIDALYLWSILRSSAVTAEWLSHTTGFGRHYVDWELIKSQRIPLISYPEQKRVGDICRECLWHEKEIINKKKAANEALSFLGLDNRVG
ncbi:MAG: N-6 DNA methylase [Candidatus Electryonea clarkiae]|nr:N-6 DNA methylase [Candidatus Electryonea clarkiae]MDP8287836.1 N-6 DNA methylase [Candidatus Electryonea clarkiae]